jgi:hypothetical protein
MNTLHLIQLLALSASAGGAPAIDLVGVWQGHLRVHDIKWSKNPREKQGEVAIYKRVEEGTMRLNLRRDGTYSVETKRVPGSADRSWTGTWSRDKKGIKLGEPDLETKKTVYVWAQVVEKPPTIKWNLPMGDAAFKVTYVLRKVK